MAKRNNAYFDGRLLKEHPAVHAAFKAGAFRSLRAACISVGLMSPRSRVSELKNAYAKATPAERVEFLDHLRRIGACASPSTTVAAPASSPRPKIGHAPSAARPAATAISKKRLPVAIAVDGVLTPQAARRIDELLVHFGWKKSNGGYQTAPLMKALGPSFSAYDASVGMALQRETRLKPNVVKALETWLIDNSAT